MSDKIPVGISACLLGEQVRFDGGHKRFSFATEELAPFMRFEPVCPEMAIGLPSPRPALRLVEGESDEPSLRFSQGQGSEVTAEMQAFSAEKIKQLSHLCGYLVCAKSPSCGMERVRVYQPDNGNNRKAGTGIFTRELMKQMPWLPVEEDGRLHDPLLRENFVGRIYVLHELHQLWAGGLTRARLIDFHSRHKLLLLAHSQPQYREIGPFVAQMDKWTSLDAFATAYRQKIMDLMKTPASRRNHTNVLMHAQGYFRPQLSGPQRRELTEIIDSYRQGIQPLLAPMTLLKHYLAQYPHPWLAAQRYFSPYPDVLRLRYGQ